MIEKYNLKRLISRLSKYEAVDAPFIFKKLVKDVEDALENFSNCIFFILCQKALNEQNILKVFEFLKQSQFYPEDKTFKFCNIVLFGLMNYLNVSKGRNESLKSNFDNQNFV